MSVRTGTPRRPFVFVAMPFAESFKQVYRKGIQPACHDAGARAERTDDQIFTESIIDRIYAQIEAADLVVADMSDRNPNVFYEVGYAHARNRQVILLTRSTQDIPFDLRAYPHVVYGDDLGLLRRELARRVKYLLARSPAARRKSVEPAVMVYHDGQPLDPTREVVMSFRNWHGNERPAVTLDFHIPAVGSFSPLNQKFGIVTSDFMTGLGDWSRGAEMTRLPDGRLLFQSDRMKYKLSPGEWFKYAFTLTFQEHVVDRHEAMAVRVFTGFGPVDLPFTLRMLGVMPGRRTE